LETVRQYCLDRLITSSEYADVQRRHQDYFLALAEVAEPKLRGPEQMVWIQRLEAEHDNLRSILERGSVATDSDVGVRLAGSLWHFWEIRGHYAEGYGWLLASVRNNRASGLPQARALAVMGILADDLCEAAQAVRYVEQGLQIAYLVGDRWWIGYALKMLGWLNRPISPADATRHLEHALSVAQEVGEPWLLAEVLSTLGYHKLYIDQRADARQHFLEGADYARKARDLWLLDELIYHLGLVACASNSYDEALLYLDECLDHQRKLDSKTRSGTSRYYKAAILFQQGKLEAASGLFRDSLLAAQDLGTRRTITSVLQAIASLAMENSQPERAALLFGAAAALGETLDTSLLPIWSADYARYRDLARASLGDEVFAVLWIRGQALSMQQAIEFALK